MLQKKTPSTKTFACAHKHAQSDKLMREQTQALPNTHTCQSYLLMALCECSAQELADDGYPASLGRQDDSPQAMQQQRGTMQAVAESSRSDGAGPSHMAYPRE